MQKTFLALSLSLAVTSVANAAWDNGGVNYGDGELLLAVWDTARATSVAVDLGVHYSTLAANVGNSSYTLAFNLDSTTLTGAFGSSNLSDLHYSLIALNNNPDSPTLLVTTNASNPMALYTDILNATNAAVVTSSAVNAVGDLNYSLNKTTSSLTTGHYLGTDNYYGTHFTNQSLPFDVTARVDQSLAMWEFNNVEATGIADAKAAGVWSIQLNDLSSAMLTYGPAAPTVPVPSAFWLMGSALVGLRSMTRKKITRPAD